MNRTLTILFYTLIALISPWISAHAASQERHINLVAFQANSATKSSNFQYEALYTESLGNLISSMEKNTHVIFATHSEALQNRDIINMQLDVMRMTKDDALANAGLDCRFFFNDESDEDSAFYSISGICDRLSASDSGTEKQHVIIPRKMLSDPSSMYIWMKFYEDPETGLAFYVDID